jgi:hypothetical protein
MLSRRAALLALPLLGAAASARAQGVAGVAELIFADVEVGGRTGAFLVDTGAPATVLDNGFAQAARVRLGEDSTLRGAGGFGAISGRIADGVELRAGAGPRITLDPAVADLAHIAQAMGRRLDGILGGDYFGRMALVLDYRTGGARFLDPGSLAPPAAATPLRIVSTPYVRAVAIHGGRRVEASFQIDTGSNTAVEFYAPFARRAFPQVKGEASESIGLTGQGEKRMARLDVFEVAGRTFNNLEANFADTLRPDDAGRDYAGIIGGPVFRGAVVTVDYARGRLWFG